MALVRALLQEFLTLQELEEQKVSLVVGRFEQWLRGRDLQSIDVRCGDDGLEIQITLSKDKPDALRLNEIDCSRFSCP